MSEGRRVYRVYRVEENGHIRVPPVVLFCDDDDDAIQRTKQLLDGADLELGSFGRLITLLKKHT